MADRASLLADLTAEGDALDAVVAGLDEAAWTTATPAEGWTIAHTIAHLEGTDRQALLAVTDPAAFGTALSAVLDRLDTLVDDEARAGAATAPALLLERWRTGRTALAEALGAAGEDRFPWFGPPMKAASMATARLMETWAHGVDVTDALGLPVLVSGRLRHVAHLGVRTRDFAFAQHGLTPPAEPFRVELTAPDGPVWTWGPDDAAQRVTGPALDFCLRVTRRRHRDDLALEATGGEADRWLDVAQAFAGPAGADRPPAGAPRGAGRRQP
ncbi:TIGR03084 family protein [Blastococcus sp. TBT05-19]|uniref:TIGR03084 family metal-binding protein n=1 Tax=Blastococcus sp. TBT05-19 TaxID=2250581 RepID=UPI000DE89C70|nr:TIGR03084 family metal-binding protein [Blastococcus sp. TBT05-19]RBY90252.1 TIGR03084 family protein [Blastococcus sp. TBT05-19]